MKLFNLSNKQMIAVILIAVVLNIIALKTDINVWLDIPCFAFASYALVLFVLLIVRNYRYFTAMAVYMIIHSTKMIKSRNCKEKIVFQV